MCRLYCIFAAKIRIHHVGVEVFYAKIIRNVRDFPFYIVNYCNWIRLLCIRIWVGKRFVHTHVDGNKALNEKGIHCVQSLDAAKRQDNPHAVSEK